MLYSSEKIEQLRKRWNTAQGKLLLKMIKQTRCYVNPILFHKAVKKFPGINDRDVKNSVDLRGAPLSGFNFKMPVQECDDGFSEDLTILSNIHFEGAMLKHCNFEDGKIHNCFFSNADLTHADFKNSAINSCNFQEADCTGLNLHGAKLTNCNFANAIIKDMTSATTLVDQKTIFGKTLYSEKAGNLYFASIEYKQIKEMYKNSGLHEMADSYHYKAMVTKRKSLKKRNPKRWLNYIFGDLLCKYGTSFIRVFIAAVMVIFLCAILFLTTKSLLFTNAQTNLSFSDCLYFSLVTFTTLGYGDFHAIGAMRFVAGAESFVGAALMALFTVIAARKIIRD